MSSTSPSGIPAQTDRQEDYDVINGHLEGYLVKRSIRISYEVISDTEVQAQFAEASFAVSGISRQDAFQALTEEILAAFDDWAADESKLGPGPKRQLAILRQYIGKGTP